MKLQTPRFNRKSLIITSSILMLGLGIVAAASLSRSQPTGAATSPIVQQVNHNTDELANHEARITNAENNISTLQGNTNTAPSAVNTSVPAVSTPAAAEPVTDPAPAPAPVDNTPKPVTVVHSGLIVGGSYDGYCSLTYSDGSQAYILATMTTATDGNNSSTTDNCSSFVGQTK